MSYKDPDTRRPATAPATAPATRHVDDLVLTNAPSQVLVVDLRYFISLLMAFITFILQGGKSKHVNGVRPGSCAFFHTEGGCRNGDSCPYSHEAAPANLGGGAKPVATASATNRGRHREPSTIICRKVNSPDGCPFGNNCKFIHTVHGATNRGRRTASPADDNIAKTVSVQIAGTSTKLSYGGVSKWCLTREDVDKFFNSLDFNKLDNIRLRNAVNDKLPKYLKH